MVGIMIYFTFARKMIHEIFTKAFVISGRHFC